MKKSWWVILIVVVLLFCVYFLLRKDYERRLNGAFFNYALAQSIPKEKIRKTDLSYFHKGNRYEYNIYIDGTSNDKYFNFFYVLPDSKFKSIVLRKKIDTKSFNTGVYIEGSVMELNEENFKRIIDKDD